MHVFVGVDLCYKAYWGQHITNFISFSDKKNERNWYKFITKCNNTRVCISPFCVILNFDYLIRLHTLWLVLGQLLWCVRLTEIRVIWKPFLWVVFVLLPLLLFSPSHFNLLSESPPPAPQGGWSPVTVSCTRYRPPWHANSSLHARTAFSSNSRACIDTDAWCFCTVSYLNEMLLKQGRRK